MNGPHRPSTRRFVLPELALGALALLAFLSLVVLPAARAQDAPAETFTPPKPATSESAPAGREARREGVRGRVREAIRERVQERRDRKADEDDSDAEELAGASVVRSLPGVKIERDLPFAEVAGVDPKHLSLDIYAPEAKSDAPRTVVLYLHGGGWAAGDKANVGGKAKFFTDLGCVFASANYRLSPAVKHPVHVEDVARALAWIRANIASRGGDGNRVVVVGHSAGAHLAALVAVDERRLKSAGADLSMLAGAILLDGAGYEIRRQFAVAGERIKKMYGQAFGEDEAGQRDASPVAHVAAGKGVPPFLILYVASRPDSKNQSTLLGDALTKAGVRAEVVPCEDKNHMTINREIGVAGDPPTEAIRKFMASLK